jgi:secretion/DNA translocation related TadE-like protein
VTVRRASSREHGSVSLVAVALLALTAALTLVSVDLFRAIAVKGAAQTAADAAALAAAQELLLPSDRSPGELAAEYASRNGAELVSCGCEPGSAEAVVTVERTISLGFLGGSRAIEARARAVVGSPEGGARR